MSTGDHQRSRTLAGFDRLWRPADLSLSHIYSASSVHCPNAQGTNHPGSSVEGRSGGWQLHQTNKLVTPQPTFRQGWPCCSVGIWPDTSQHCAGLMNDTARLVAADSNPSVKAAWLLLNGRFVADLFWVAPLPVRYISASCRQPPTIGLSFVSAPTSSFLLAFAFCDVLLSPSWHLHIWSWSSPWLDNHTRRVI